MRKDNRKKIPVLLKSLFLAWIIYMAVSLLIPPLFHKRVPGDAGNEDNRTGYGEARERVRSIDNNMDALLWRLRLIEAAREKVVLCTFDFRDDNGGRDMMSALFHAAGRGVQVQIMVDGINGMLYLNGSGNFRELANHENVQVKFYNPVNLVMPWRNNYRMHDKYLIADDFAYILGGRNTDDLFLGNYTDSYNEDRDILVYEAAPGEGRSYRQLLEYFEKIWELPCAKPYQKKDHGRGTLEEHYADLREKYPEAFTETVWEEATMETNGIELCTNPMEPKNKQPLLWKRMVEEMKKEEDIFIQTPYIICSRDIYRDLTDVCSQGRKVEIITNAVESGANPFGCTDYLNQKEKIYKTGVHVYEYAGGQALHTKTILPGDELCIVGSCNLDMRSIYLDTEMMLFIESKELNECIRSQGEELKKQSRHHYPDGRAEDGESYHPVDTGALKNIFYGVMRVIIVPIRHLL